MKSALMLGMSVLAVAAAAGVSARAQDAPGGGRKEGLEDVVVTAQRRSEDVQHTALSVTAVSGDQLERRGISQTGDLSSLTAGLQVQPSGGPYTTFAVRGVSQLGGNAFADPTVAVNINGVYLATPTVIHGLYLDVDRVEILKGPQGTLYGRNATAGAINVISAKPRHVFGGQRGGSPHASVEILTVDELHDDRAVRTILDEVVCGNDVGMHEAPHRVHLTPHALARLVRHGG